MRGPLRATRSQEEHQWSNRITMTMPQALHSLRRQSSYRLSHECGFRNRKIVPGVFYLHVSDSVEASNIEQRQSPDAEPIPVNVFRCHDADARRAVVRTIQPSPSRTSASALRVTKLHPTGLSARYPYVGKWYFPPNECLIGRIRGERRYSKQ